MTPEKRREWQRQYRAKNLERIRAWQRGYYKRNKEKAALRAKQKYAKNAVRMRGVIRKNYLDRRYGPGGAEHYDRMFAEQNGKCAICGEPPREGKYGKLHQDHDTACCPYRPRGKGNHTREIVTCGKCRRGLLCNKCNAALSGLERSGWLRKALRYLRRWKKPEKQLAPIVDLLAKLKRDLEQ